MGSPMGARVGQGAGAHVGAMFLELPCFPRRARESRFAPPIADIVYKERDSGERVVCSLAGQ